MYEHKAIFRVWECSSDVSMYNYSGFHTQMRVTIATVVMWQCHVTLCSMCGYVVVVSMYYSGLHTHVRVTIATLVM